MLFNSYGFIFVFLPILLLGWNVLLHFHKRRAALLFLTGMGCFLYGAFNWYYLVILFVSMAVMYLLSGCLQKVQAKKIPESSPHPGKWLMVTGVVFQLVLLGYFKYTDFFLENINALAGSDFALRNILLPVGISFYTFSQIAFIVDRYREEIPHYDLLTYAAFVLYFPKILQGPIAFPKEIIDQFNDEQKLSWNTERFAQGIVLFIIGLSKKVLLADSMALVENYVFDQAYYLDTICVLIAGISCALNIYFDFSGYCDMADGISRMLGIDLPQNFNSPFKAASVQELWQRWHITLSRFLIKYVYIPLGGSRKGEGRTIFNIFFIFFLSGLWHGSGWTYVVWGVLNGLLVIWDHLHLFKKMPRKLGQVLTFLFFSFSVIFFRADSLTIAFTMIRRLFFFTWPGFVTRTAANLELSETYIFQEGIQQVAPAYLNGYFVVLMLVIFLLCFFLLTRPNAREIAAQNTYSRKKILFLAFIAVLSILSLSQVQTYVYFNF